MSSVDIPISNDIKFEPPTPDSGIFSANNSESTFQFQDTQPLEESTPSCVHKPSSSTKAELSWKMNDSQIYRRRVRSHSWPPTARIPCTITRSSQTDPATFPAIEIQQNVPDIIPNVVGWRNPIQIDAEVRLDPILNDEAHLIGGQLALLGDDFDNYRGAIGGVAFPNRIIMGVFFAAPVPQWFQGILAMVGIRL